MQLIIVISIGSNPFAPWLHCSPSSGPVQDLSGTAAAALWRCTGETFGGGAGKGWMVKVWKVEANGMEATSQILLFFASILVFKNV